MASGYSCANAALSWIEKEKFRSFAFVDKDLSGAGVRKLLPWKGYYFKASHCRLCQMVVIDYSKKFDRKSVESEIRVANDLARA
jgi:hypothetical protein